MIPTKVSDIVACMALNKRDCLTPRELTTSLSMSPASHSPTIQPSPSKQVSKSMSSFPVFSPPPLQSSSSIPSNPSVLPHSQVPLSAKETTPPRISSTSLMSSSPSLWPSPKYVHEGQPCTARTICEPGIGCGCLGKCTKRVRYIIHGIGSDRLLPYVCGKPITPETKSSHSFGR